MISIFFETLFDLSRLKGGSPILFVGIGGLLICGYQIFVMLIAAKTDSWPVIEGIILKSDITESTDFFADSHMSAKTYSNQIQYSYIVDGKKYISNRIFIGDKIFYPGRDFTEKLKTKYYTSQKVFIYFDPKQPEKSVLEKGIHKMNIFIFFVGVFLISFVIIIY